MGFQDFISTGCIACHMGVNLGGHMYQKLGILKAWPDLKDLGRFDATQVETDKYFFKVPSLRNIAKTDPYLHDGSVASLEEIVKKMAEFQSGQMLSDEKTASIVTFLNVLTGDLPTEYIEEPELPASGPDTPAPDPS